MSVVTTGLFFEIDIVKHLPIVVPHNKAAALFFNGPRRRKAA